MGQFESPGLFPMYLKVLLACPHRRLGRLSVNLKAKQLPVGADQGLRCDPWTAITTRHPGRCPGPLPRFRECGARKRGPLSDPTPVVWAFARLGRIPKILDLVMGPVAVSHMINLEGYTERTRVWSAKCTGKFDSGPNGRTPGDRNGIGKV